MTKKVKLNKKQSYVLDMHLRENAGKYNFKSPKEISDICSEDLGFEISPSTIVTTRNAMIAASVPVWEVEEKRKYNPSKTSEMEAKVNRLENLIAEQDRKFSAIFAKLHAISVYGTPLLNGNDPDMEGGQWEPMD